MIRCLVNRRCTTRHRSPSGTRHLHHPSRSIRRCTILCQIRRRSAILRGGLNSLGLSGAQTSAASEHDPASALPEGWWRTLRRRLFERRAQHSVVLLIVLLLTVLAADAF
jgi:hypothetical protein